MEWYDYRLTETEIDGILRQAGIGTDPRDWNEETLKRVSILVNQEWQRKFAGNPPPNVKGEE